MIRYDNKDFLHTIALHLELFNTIGGGVSETYAKVEKGHQEAVIEIWAATTDPQSFKIALRKNKLTMSSGITSHYSSSVRAPLFSRTFILPSVVNLVQIEATYLEGKLQLKLPYHQSVDRPKEINIKQL
ncbi:HSP20 family molecular chaperone IbpA [Pontibacter aydingkolensis]|uniref:Hsp20 family protein n=1 Tax=Pontibacter aydingkolensis TaxID=1911536 RepID=A0ABS7CTC8_9BACT|nr:Hsp20 family protein [Pontibacter aydingkolensis]MBW7467099.1 Hsp20 family protein [Pontibacter aydingkolensis]